ncbi:MAG: HAMP domain-containing sensor histidine kinase [Hyphomonadaceae bacterium]|nr:HAMP domain-containing sensor histidine kinase [Hyphomonadaceae bacterium]
MRFLAIGVAVLTATPILGDYTALIWFAGVSVVLFGDHIIFARTLRACEAGVPPALWKIAAWTAAQSAYINFLGALLWFAKYMHGETLAVIYLIGGLANAAATLRFSKPLSIAGLGPSALYLLTLPLIDYFFVNGRNPLDLLPLVGVLMLFAFGLQLWRKLLQSDAAIAQAEAAVLRERQSAAAAAAAKSDTIRRMNDELRTPMTALIGAAEHLQRAAASPAARAQISTIVHASEVLKLVLDDLTELDQLENGLVKIELKPADPRELARNVVSAFRAAAHDKGLEIFLDIDADAPALVEIDAARVRQILFNLVSNAVRFTKNGGVRVRLQAQPALAPGRVRLGFVVADTGEGMSRSQLALALSRERYANAGPGLGLTISLRLARLMGGKIGGKSELGEGSVFSFVIEASLARAAGQTAA